MQLNNRYAYGNTTEMLECNKIAEYAKTALKRCGFEAKKAPQGQSMQQSIKESNAWSPDLHITIHTNAFNGKTLGGTLVMIYSMEYKNKRASQAFLDAVAPVSPGPDYILRVNPSLAELNSTKTIGKAICKGVCSYFGVTYKESSTELSGNFYRWCI